MLKAGAFVSYSTTGICEISEIKKMGAAGKEKEYYVLKPVYQKNATVYIPLDNALLLSKIRPVVTKEEIDEIIIKAKNNPLEWISDDFDSNVAFKEILSSGNLLYIIRLVSCIYIQGEELSRTKRRLRAVDSSAFSNAESYLYNEFAFALNIKPEQVIEYIENKMKE